MPTRPFIRFRALALLLTTVTAVLGTASPAHADDVTVTLSATVADTVPWSVIPLCNLDVPSGSDGIVVLEEGVAEHCIASYDMVDFGGSLGEFVTCINELCGGCIDDDCTMGTFWAIYIDGTASSVGVSNMNFTDDAELAFNYETWGV